MDENEMEIVLESFNALGTNLDQVAARKMSVDRIKMIIDDELMKIINKIYSAFYVSKIFYSLYICL